jgi:hypothetical protein
VSASTIATIVLAVVAALALIANVVQIRLTQRSLAAAERSIREAQRTRIDAAAPRVIVRESPDPVWPGAQAQSVVSGGRNDLRSGMRFDLPGSANTRLLMSTYVCLENESDASALLTMPVGGIQVTGDRERPDDAGDEPRKWSLGQRLKYRLGPHECRWFLLESGHTVERWAELWQHSGGRIESVSDDAGELLPGVRFTIEVRSQQRHAFRDELTIEVLGFPIEPIEGAIGGWTARTFVRTTLDLLARTRVLGVQRTYDED